jgi:hypothetical protein
MTVKFCLHEISSLCDNVELVSPTFVYTDALTNVQILWLPTVGLDGFFFVYLFL